MKADFQLSCESTVDMPFSYVSEREIPVLFYSYSVAGKVYPDDMGRDPEAMPRFYRMLKEEIPVTSQINESTYFDFFETLLQNGDVLHITFGSGMTPSVRNAETAAEKLRQLYPNRNIMVIDSLCSSTGYGLLVDEAADLRDKGCSMEKTAEWVLANRHRVHHQFFSTDLKYYRRSGRMSGAAAAVAAVLDICPLMRLDDAGRIVAYSKVRGKKNAVRETVRVMEEHAQNGKQYQGKCYICHSQCMEEAMAIREALIKSFPQMPYPRIFDIGTIIASHCGPGTVAVFFIGDTRLSEEERQLRNSKR